MKRYGIVPVLVVWTAVLNTAGCAALRARQVAKGEKTLVIKVDQIEYHGLGPRGLVFDVPLEMHNHSKGQARLTAISLEVLLNGRRVASSVRKVDLLIEPLSKHAFHMPVYVDPVTLLAGALSKTHKLVFHGEVTTDLGVLGPHRSSFRSEKVLLSHKHARPSLQGVSMRKSRLAELCLTIDLKQPKVAEDPLKSSSLTGKVFLNDVPVAQVDSKNTVLEDGLIRIEVRIPTLRSAMIVARIIKARRFSIRIEGLYTARTETLKYRIPCTFERKDISF